MKLKTWMAKLKAWTTGLSPSTSSNCSADIMAGVIAVQMANCADMVADVNGPYPACKNKLYTYECERCGRDVRGTTDACPSIPPEKRWNFRSMSPPNAGDKLP